MCRKQKFLEWPKNPRRHVLENIKITGERIKTRGPTPYPWGWGARPYLVGPLTLHRPQLQLHIFRFTENNIREDVSSRFTIQSRRQALISLRRADLKSVRGSGEGDSSPSSSSTILHHQFHDAHCRAWVLPSWAFWTVIGWMRFTV